ncbi:FMN-binding protein [Arthrobacter sp. MPF02]|uniref:FMN-binding protein n=1 Tax=Arthrobacter sp. MPF02 TaxID=3388492 RepID=UPI00398528B4
MTPAATRSTISRTLYAGIAGLSLAGTVAGCAPSATETAPASTGSGTAETSAAAPSPGSSPLAGSGSTYKDGTYSADGNYVSPNGTETVGVQLTLASGTVTDVQITQHPSNPNTRKFQGEFAGGIADQVVGKNIDDLNVSKVAGSSLTSGGFNQAVEQIKSEAQ